MNRVCIVGSINMDMVLSMNQMPRLGETITLKNMDKLPGGKGANQAVAAKRCGSSVSIIGKLGTDTDGDMLLAALNSDGIDTKYVFRDEVTPTGLAVIMVDREGNNSIMVNPGSNIKLEEEDIRNGREVIENSEIIAAQLEIPVEAVKAAFKVAKAHGKLTVLNPSPAENMEQELYKYTDIIIPNETEAEALTGIVVKDLESSRKAAEIFFQRGIKIVIITLGDKGAVINLPQGTEHVPAVKVKITDTTAAGDSFLGAVISDLDVKDVTFENIEKAVRFGNMVASIVVQRKGAQPSIPYLEEVMEIYNSVK